MNAPVTLTVVVPTYRRPAMLARCLDQVISQVRLVHDSGIAAIEPILVIDNDPDGGAHNSVAGYGSAVRYLHEATPGIAAVRATALREVETRLLAFIDDDEVPLDGWLSTLIETWLATGAQAVTGRVEAAIDGAAHPWITAGDLFGGRPRLATGTPVPVAAAGNLLLDAEWCRRVGITFDERLGLGGGEDTLFSYQLTAAGGSIVWCDESLAEDHVPADRLTLRWLMRRFFSQGHASVVVDLLAPAAKGRRTRIRTRAVVGGLARAAAGVARFALGILRGAHRDRGQGMRLTCRGAGMVWAATGAAHHEYARTARPDARSRPGESGQVSPVVHRDA